MLKLKTITAKFILLGIIMLLFFCAYIVPDYIFLHHINGEAARINIAGRLRMLTVDFGRHMLEALERQSLPERNKIKEHVSSDLQEFDEILLALKNGSDKYGIRPIHGKAEEAVLQLEKISALWQKELRQRIQQTLEKSDRKSATEFNAQLYALLGQFDLLVKYIEQHESDEIRNFERFRFVTIIIFLAANMLIILYVRKSMVRPIIKLRNAALAIEGGNFDVKVEIKTDDELGALGNTVNNMARRLKISFDENALKQRQLLENEASLKKAQKIAHLGNWEWDIPKNRLQWSEEIYNILGVEPGKFEGTYETFLNYVHLEDLAFVKRSVNEALHENKPYSLDHRIALPDGSERIVHEQAEVSFDETGKPTWMSGTIQDITERKQAEDEIREYRDHLEELVEERTKELETARQIAEAASRAKSDFLANMSHELRTPLNAIIGFSEVIRDGLAGEISSEQKEYVNDIWESGRHLLRLINDILDLAKIEAGRMKLEPGEFELDKLIANCLSLFREKAMRHGINLASDIAGDINSVRADELKLKQVILNLLGNAFKFTPDGGAVRVSARRVKCQGSRGKEDREARSSAKGKGEEGIPLLHDPMPPDPEADSSLATCYLTLDPDGNFIEISVEDTGIGISPEDQQQLFQPFQQLESILTKKYEGTGLGLKICWDIVALHKGRIWVESEPGKGSRFIFIIPSGKE